MHILECDLMLVVKETLRWNLRVEKGSQLNMLVKQTTYIGHCGINPLLHGHLCQIVEQVIR